MVNLLLKVPGVDKLALNNEDKTPFEIARNVTEYHESFRTIRRLRGSRPGPRRFMYCAPQVSHIKYNNAMSNKAYEARRDAELVVAALLAAMTCAALFTVPGGFNSESPSDVQHDQGSPLLVSLVSFKLFIIFDCIAFFLSLFVCTMWELSADLNTKNKRLFMNVNAMVVCLSFGFSASGFMCAVYAMLARKARFDRLVGVSWFFDDIVEKVWCAAERCGLLNLSRFRSGCFGGFDDWTLQVQIT
ncbi:hypothetical protein SUGI_0029030 [Cryptomeria japonica]|nr:hypothetical protein SUGI_0029030 [Cryptomeria japonica]